MCSDCGNERSLVGNGLCEDCYRSRNPDSNQLIECSECGRTRIHIARGLCRSCYVKSNVVECGECGETKPHAARGLCHRCYKRLHRDPGIIEREAAREADLERVLAQQLAAQTQREAEVAAELRRRRCKTCRRLLILVQAKASSHRRSHHCDNFCYSHDPDQRARRGSTRWFPAVKAKIDARKAEADRQMTEELELSSGASSTS